MMKPSIVAVPTELEPIASQEKSLAKSEESSDKDSDGAQYIDLVIAKRFLGDRLGLDVAHVDGRLLVLEILEGMAVDGALRARARDDPSSGLLRAGDVIVDVNGVAGPSAAMVAELEQNAVLRILAVRL